MEDIISEIEAEHGITTSKVSSDFTTEDVETALAEFLAALRNALPLLKEMDDIEKVKSKEEGEFSSVNAQWLLNVCAQVPSELGAGRLARAVWDASQLTSEGQQQEALYAALGASEESMAAMFELAPNLPSIQKNISQLDIDSIDESGVAYSKASLVTEIIDPEEANRQKLRQEAIDAAQVAGIAKAEAEAMMGPVAGTSTHSISRKSDLEAQKMAKKAAKRAAQAMERAKAAGAIIDESELLEVNNASLGSGGLVGRSIEELREMQSSLLPAGSRQLHKEEGLPSDTIRDFNEEIGYEIVTLPPPKVDPSKLPDRIVIKDVLDPECARAFSGTESLNPMQSMVFDTAFNRRENLLICAPTGAGKTNCALLTVTAHFRDVGLIGDNDGKEAMETGKKVVYIAPMKALAQEVVEKFTSKLKPLGLIVRELTGDMQLTRAEAQAANVIVTTPEKWDVVTRKSGNDDNSLGNQCGLLIIDEVHLLADERGAVIESVVSRLHRLVESRQRQQRIVGLSATLPNYKDVAEFLQVPERGLFFFGPEHRPVPLQQSFIGVTGKVKDRHLIETKMNAVCFETVKDSLERGYQVMVFVHSRKGTSDTATALAELAAASGDLDRLFVAQSEESPAGAARKRYSDRVMKSRNREVANHFYKGMGIHHAGMLRGDRKLSESMFADGAIKVLCCTATLAWGVNLPAHTVVIKGTEVYNPERGRAVDLSILDVQQIFGRAGRPQFDTSGEATLITTHEALPRYLDKLVRAVPIESNFTKQLADHLNAEIVGGTVTNISEAATWLGYTYLYVRMLRNPLAYGITADQKADDPMLRGRCTELVTDAAVLLAQNRMINFNLSSSNFGMTDLGRVAAHFYIQAESISTFQEMMKGKSYFSDSDLCFIISSAAEFENLRVRQEEQDELAKLQSRCPLKRDTSIHDSATKSFVLIQSFISREQIKSFTLISDTNYIASNAGRVARAMFEMCLKTNKAGTALKLLRIAKSVDNQCWWFQSPLRRFEGEISMNVFKALESRTVGSDQGYDALESTMSLLDMSPDEVGQLCHVNKNAGEKILNLIHMLPKPLVECKVMPVTDHILKFHLRIYPDFTWHGRWHGGAVMFWLWIEDTENDKIYHHEHIVFSKKMYPNSVDLALPIPTFGRIPTQYLVRVVSDSWVGVEVTYPISLRDLKVPHKASTNTRLLDLVPLSTSALQEPKYETLYSKIPTFNPIQTQLFHVVYHTDTPVFLGAPTGSGKTIVAELALLRMKKRHPRGICVYIAPLKSLARERLKGWSNRLGAPPLNWKVLELSGDTHHDRRIVEKADVLVCTPEKWDLISRGWKDSTDDSLGSNSFVKRVRLLVIDEIHLLGEERGAVLEAIVSRMRFISQYLRQNDRSRESSMEDIVSEQHELVRIVGLSTAVANPFDLANWIGIDTDSHNPRVRRGLYNFSPSVRPVQTKVHVQGYPGKHYCPRMATMNKPCYAAIKDHAPDRPSLIFVASRRQTRLTAFDIISYAAGDLNPKMFLGCDDAYIEAIIEAVQDEALKHTLQFGIGLHHAGLSSHDRDIVERLYLGGEIRVLVATATLAWGVNLPARLVIVKGTEYFDGKISRYVDYPITDCLQMIGRAGRFGFDTEGKAVVMVETSKKNFYKEFLYKPFPVESCLGERLCENINAEIVTGTVNSVIDAVGYLTWTFFARRVRANPSYYGAPSASDEDVDRFFLSVVEDTVQKLRDHNCVERNEEDELKATTLGTACSNFYLQYRTPNQMQFGLIEACKIIMREMGREKQLGGEQSPKTTEFFPYVSSARIGEVAAGWVLYTLSNTHEFDELPVRHNEEILNEELSGDVAWGADTSSLLNADGGYTYVNPEVYADPHTKCFLLLQAHLQKTRLPISDYVNDTKSVIEQIPRLLAAMFFIATQSVRNSGSFDMVCHLVKTRQLFETMSSVDLDPLYQLPGAKKGYIQNLLKECRTRDMAGRELYALRKLPRDDAAAILGGASKRSGGISVKNVLNFLYSAPLVTIKGAEITSNVEKSTNMVIGVLKLTLEIQLESGHRKSDGNGEAASLTIVLGTKRQSILLSSVTVPVSRTGSWSVTKEMKFDWKIANENGGERGGQIILRVLIDGVRGLDAEALLRLEHPG